MIGTQEELAWLRKREVNKVPGNPRIGEAEEDERQARIAANRQRQQEVSH